MSPLFSFVAAVIVKAVPFPIVRCLRIDVQADLFVKPDLFPFESVWVSLHERADSSVHSLV